MEVTVSKSAHGNNTAHVDVSWLKLKACSPSDMLPALRRELRMSDYPGRYRLLWFSIAKRAVSESLRISKQAIAIIATQTPGALQPYLHVIPV